MTFRSEASIDFIRGYMEEIKIISSLILFPISLTSLKQPECACYICLQKCLRPKYGPIHMRLGSEVDDTVDLLRVKQPFKQGGIPYIPMYKPVSLTMFTRPDLKISGVSGIGQGIEVDDAPIRFHAKGMKDEIGAYESGAAGD